MDIERILSGNPNIFSGTSLHKAIRKEREVETEQAISLDSDARNRREQNREEEQKQEKKPTYTENAVVVTDETEVEAVPHINVTA